MNMLAKDCIVHVISQLTSQEKNQNWTVVNRDSSIR